MADKKKQKGNKTATQPRLVTVAISTDLELAGRYKNLLERNGITATIRSHSCGDNNSFKIALAVPYKMYEKAYDLIDSNNYHDDYFESIINSTKYHQQAG